MTDGTPQNEGAVRPRRPYAGSRRRHVILFAVAALCFFLPFGTVSCGGDEKVEVTGVQLVSRTVPDAHEELGEPNLAQQVEDGAFALATIALLAVLAGLGLAARAPAAIGNTFLVALGGILALLSLPAKAVLELADVTLGPGYVAALAIELWLAADCLVLLVRRRRGRLRPAHGPRPRQKLPPDTVSRREDRGIN